MFYFDDVAWEQRALPHVARLRNVHRVVQATVQPEQVAGLIEHSRTYPTLPASVLTGAAMAGLSPDDDAMHMLAMNITDRQQEGFNFFKTLGGIGSTVGSGLRGVIRNVFTGFEGMWEEVIARPTRTIVGVYQGMGLGEAYSMAGSSYAWRALQEWAQNPLGHSLDWLLPGEQIRQEDRINLGSGFFGDSDVVTSENAMDNQAVQSLLASGVPLDQAMAQVQSQLGAPITHQARQDAERIQISRGGVSVPVSPGRLLAITVTEPGTQPFNLISGFADAAAQIYVDPADKLLKGVRLAQLASNTILEDGARKTIRSIGSPTVSEFMASPLMRDAAEWTAAQGPDQFASIRHVWGRKLAPTNGSNRFLKALTDETDPDNVLGLVREGIESGLYQRAPLPLALGPGVRRGFTSSRVGQKVAAKAGDPSVGFYGGFRVGLRHRLEGTTLGRLFSEMGGTAIPVANPAIAVDELEKFLSSAGFGADEASRYLYRMASVPDGEYESALRVVSDAVNDFGRQLAEDGIPEPVVFRMTELYSTQESLRKYFIDQAGNPAWFPGARMTVTIDGKPHILPSAQLMTEFVNQAIPLPDPRKVRKALHQARSQAVLGVGRMATDWDDLSPGALTKMADFYISKVWKPMTLLRVAWPVRVIGEEQLRMLGADMLSMFNHPMQYVGWMLSSQGRLGKKFPSLVSATVRGEQGLVDELADADEFVQAMSTVSSFGLDAGRFPGQAEFVTLRAGEAGYYVGWHRELHQLVNDPIASELLGAVGRTLDDDATLLTSSVHEIKQRFWDGDLAQHRRRFIRDSGRWELLHNRREADGYIDSVMARLHLKTGGDFVYFRPEGPQGPGRWFDSSGNPLDPEQIPRDIGGFANPVAHDDLSHLISEVFPGSSYAEGFADEYAQALVDALPSGSFRDEVEQIIGDYRGAGAIATRQAEVVDDLDQVRRAAEQAGALTPSTRRTTTARGLEWIPGNELEAMRQLGRARAGGQSLGGEALETIGPIKKMDPLTPQQGHPDNAAFRVPRGLDLDHPESVMVSRDGVVHARIDLVWGPQNQLDEMHIKASDMATGSDLIKLFDEFSALEFDRLDVVDMLFGGVPIREWLLESPALRGLADQDLASLDVADLLKKIADEDLTAPSWGVEEMIGAVNDNDLFGIDPSEIATLGAGRNRIGGMWAGAFERSYTAQWSAFLEEVRRGTYPLPDPTVGGSIDDFITMLDRSPFRNMWQDLTAALDEAGGMRAYGGLEPDELAATLLADAAESRLLTDVRNRPQEMTSDALEDLSAASGISPFELANEDQPITSTSRLPLAPPPQGYPLSYQGARSLSVGVGRWLQPEAIRELPQHRVQYHITRPGNPELLRELANGRLGKVDLTNIRKRSDVRAAADELRRFQGSRPAFVKGTRDPDAQTLSDWDRVMREMFSTLMSKPTNKLSRSPAFRQFYWKRVAHMFAWEDGTVQAELLRLAKDAGIEETFIRNEIRNAVRKLIGRDEIGRTEAAIGKLRGREVAGVNAASLIEQGDLATRIEEIDTIAKAFALEETQRLLYDISRKHDIADMLRNIFPFAEAWGEIFSSWIRIMTTNPRMARRFQQGVEGARGAGFFYDDPTTGEEVFNYPGSGMLAKWMLGTDPEEIGGVTPQLSGRVAGLNLIGGGYLPGFGPIVQIPASTLFEDYFNNPANRWVRDLVLPFGESELESPGDIIDLGLPAWFRRGLTSIGAGGGDNERLYANTVMDVYKALITGGSETDATPEQAAQALDRAKDIARNLYLIRALAQFNAPTGPMVRFDVRDRTGQVWAFASLSAEYRRIQEANDFDEIASFNAFTERFGLDPTLFATAKTRSVVRRSTTESGRQWEAENPDLFERDNYFLTAYFARPDDPFAEFDYTAYRNQLEAGTRQPLTEDQWVRVRNDFLGRVAYEHARRMVIGRTDDIARAWLRQTRFQLMEEYPGYNEPAVGLAERADREAMIREFRRWENDPRLAESEAGQGLIRFLQKRDQALAVAAQMGISEAGFSSAKRVAYLRRWLEDVGRYMATMYPDFGPIYDQVFRRELEDEENQPVELLGATYG